MKTDTLDTQEDFIDDMIEHLQYMKAHLGSECLFNNVCDIIFDVKEEMQDIYSRLRGSERIYSYKYITEEEMLKEMESKE